MKRGILLVDDHELVRKGIRSVLDGHFTICGEASDGQEALVKVMTMRPELVILDISMPVMNGFDAARQIRAAVPATKILLLSTHDSAQVEAEAKAVGADAFLSKAAPASKLVEVIEQLLAATKRDDTGIDEESPLLLNS